MIYRYIYGRSLTFLFLTANFFSLVNAQVDSSIASSGSAQCYPQMTFLWKNNSLSLCLNRFNPPDDSCSAISVFFKTLGIRVNFSCNRNHSWTYEGLGYSNLRNQKIPANITLSTNESGNIIQGSVFFGNIKDSLDLWIDHIKVGDIPVIPDSTKPLDYDINFSKFICIDKIITDRQFTYPADYMRKEPILNHPELSAFHWGPEIRMPTSASVQVRGNLIIEHKIFHTPKLKYDDPELIRKKEIYNTKWTNRHPPKKKKKRTRPALLHFKPL